MDQAQREAVAAISLMAAMADGNKSDVEREQIRKTFALIAGDQAIDQGGIYYRVLLKQTNLPAEAAKFAEPEQKQFVYEMALSVCDADGQSSPAEREFLEHLRSSLGLEASVTNAMVKQADDLAIVPVPATVPAAPLPPPVPQNTVQDEINASALRYAILTAAIELLPQNLATVAIIPLQSKMVYEVGKRYGYNLDRRHILDFLGVVGVSMTGQVLEGYARKFMGNLGGMLGGKLGGMVGGMTGGSMGRSARDWGKRGAEVMTGAAMTFATTYALAQVASVYYANKRTLPAAELKRAFGEQVNRAMGLFPSHQAEVERQSRTINIADIPRMIRG